MYAEQALNSTLDRHLDLLAHAQAKRYRTHPRDRSDPADSPLLAFLKSTLPRGVRPASLRQSLSARLSPTLHALPLELAYALSATSTGTPREILDLYLLEAASVPLAVRYALSPAGLADPDLWPSVVSHCALSNGGSSLATLLKSAAAEGADMCDCVRSIPEGARVPGLKALLLEAVSGYRSKVRGYERAKGRAEVERDDLEARLGRERRRGRRAYDASLEGPEGGDKKVKRKTRSERWKAKRALD